MDSPSIELYFTINTEFYCTCPFPVNRSIRRPPRASVENATAATETAATDASSTSATASTTADASIPLPVGAVAASTEAAPSESPPAPETPAEAEVGATGGAEESADLRPAEEIEVPTAYNDKVLGESRRG